MAETKLKLTQNWGLTLLTIFCIFVYLYNKKLISVLLFSKIRQHWVWFHMQLQSLTLVSVCWLRIHRVLSHVSVLQVKCFTPQSQAGCLCPQPQTAVCPSGASWPQSGSFIWPGKLAWTAVPRAGSPMGVFATRWPGPAQTVEGASRVSALWHPTLLLTTPQRYTMPTATEVRSVRSI